MSVAWRPEGFPHVARDFPKNLLISQKIAQKFLKESQKFLFVAKVAQKLFTKIVPWFVRTVCCRSLPLQKSSWPAVTLINLA